MRTIWSFVIAIAVIGCRGELEVEQPAAGGPTTSVGFRPQIQGDLDALGCTQATCHAASSNPMRVAPSPASDAGWQANYDAVKLHSGSVGASPLVDYASGAAGHADALGSHAAIRDRWLQWIAGGVPYQASAAPADGP